MSIRYAIQVVRVGDDLYEAQHSSWMPGPSDQLAVFVPEEFGESIYVIDGPQNRRPEGRLSFEDMRDWFEELDGSFGKEPGKGVEQFRVSRRN